MGIKSYCSTYKKETTELAVSFGAGRVMVLTMTSTQYHPVILQPTRLSFMCKERLKNIGRILGAQLQEVFLVENTRQKILLTTEKNWGGALKILNYGVKTTCNGHSCYMWNTNVAKAEHVK